MIRDKLHMFCSSAALTALAFSAVSCSSGGETGGVTRSGGTNDTVALEDVALDFEVANYENTARHETVCVSIPFPEGAVNNLDIMSVDGHDTSWLPLQTWADGSVRIGQAQITVEIPANTTKTFTVVQNQNANISAFQQHPWVASGWGASTLGARVRDTFGHLYEAEISGEGETLQTSAKKRVRRWRLYHETAGGGGGIGRDFLTSTFYVSEFRDTPFVMVDWIFGNDYLGIDDTTGQTDPNMFPLGPVDVDDVALLTDGFADVHPFKADWHDVQNGVLQGDGRTAHVVMDNTWIGDGCCRRYRFLARFEDGGAGAAERQEWQDAFEAFKEGGPVQAMTAILAFQQCKALGLLGGPLSAGSDVVSRADQDWNSWVGDNHFGTWEDFGDVKSSNATGTPRNSGLGEEVAHAVQSRNLRLLYKLEAKAWAQANRPQHLYGLQVGAEQMIYLWDGIPMNLNNVFAGDISPESLGRRALKNSDPWPGYRTRKTGNNPHNWTRTDISHWTTDLLFEYRMMTGDEWAKEELRQMGQQLRGIMHYHSPMITSKVMFTRAEGWTMHSYVQCYLATGDETLKAKALRRTQDIIDAGRLKNHPSKALRITPNANNSGFPGSNVSGPGAVDNEFIAAWQNYAVFYGYLGAYKFFDHPLFLEIAEGSVSTIDYAWLEDYTDNNGNYREHGLRYSCLFAVNGVEVAPSYYDTHPDYNVNFASGTGRMNAAGLLHVARMTSDAEVAAKARDIAFKLVPVLSDTYRWQKWTYMLPEAEYVTEEE